MADRIPLLFPPTSPAVLAAAVPTGPTKLKSAGDVSIQGSKLVVPNGYMFPPVCLQSGATTGLEAPVLHEAISNSRRTAGILVGGIVGALITATGKEESGCYSSCISIATRRRWRRDRNIGGFIIAAAAGCIIASVNYRSTLLYLLPLGFLLLIAGLAMACSAPDKKIRVYKMKEGKLWIGGISRKVRQQIVQFEYRRLQSIRMANEEHQARARAQAAAAMAPAAVPPPIPPGVPAHLFPMPQPGGTA